jgi:hypothetical protein
MLAKSNTTADMQQRLAAVVEEITEYAMAALSLRL